MLQRDFESLQEMCGSTITSVLASDTLSQGYVPTRSGHPFIAQAEQQFRLFRSEAPLDAPLTGIEYGYKVLGRAAYSCYRSYLRYCETEAVDFEAVTLGASLKNPRTVRFLTGLAGMHDGLTRYYEARFGLKYDDPPQDHNVFQFNATKGCFVPNPELIARVKLDITKDNILRSERSGCPARRYLPALWHVIVDTTLETDFL